MSSIPTGMPRKLRDKSYFYDFLCSQVFEVIYQQLGFYLFIYFNWRLNTLQYCSVLCHTLAWISHGCTCDPHPEPPSHIPPHSIPQRRTSTLALSALSHASNLDWWSISHMIIYMFQCYSLKSSHPRLLPQSPKVCSLSVCLFCCLSYRLIITIFLNSIYICANILHWCFSF